MKDYITNIVCFLLIVDMVTVYIRMKNVCICIIIVSYIALGWDTFSTCSFILPSFNALKLIWVCLVPKDAQGGQKCIN